MKHALLASLAVVFLTLAETSAPALASSAIRNEPGEPYNKPVRLSRPRMVCVIGATAPQRICPTALAPPLTECACDHAGDIGLRYFVAEPQQNPTVFTFDGYQDVYTVLRRTLSGLAP